MTLNGKTYPVGHGRVRLHAAVSRVKRGWRIVTEYVASMLGERDYDRYVDHLKRTHPGTPIPSAGEYWRQRYAEQDANPSARCC